MIVGRVMQQIAGWSHGWCLAWGRWWSVYWSLERLFSLGVHVEYRRRPCNLRTGEHLMFGPYVDIHLPTLCISLGNNPAYVGSLDAQRQFARGGIPVCPRCSQLT